MALQFFPGGSDRKEPACRCRGPRFNPRVREIPWRREWLPPPVFLPGKFIYQNIHPFKTYESVVCNIVTVLCNHPHCLNSRTFSSSAKVISYPLAITPLFPIPRHKSASHLYVFAYSGHFLSMKSQQAAFCV